MLKDKVSDFFTKSSSTHSRDGYLSEPHADITVDAHGGVHVQREVLITESPPPAAIVQPTRHDLRKSADTTDMICAQYYDDIELGSFTTGRNSHLSSPEDADVEALPALPHTPKSPRSMRSFMSFHRQSKSPRIPAHPDWPLPATIAEERHDDGPRQSLHFPRSASQKKPDWQSWT
jgi:hypothetical protein